MRSRAAPTFALLILVPALVAIGCATGEPATAPEAPGPVSPPSSATPASSAAEGRIAGAPFHVEASRIENGILELREGDDLLANRQLMIFLFLDKGELPENRTFEVGPDTGFGAPHIHMSWKTREDGMPETAVFMDKYVMHLQFGAEREGVLPGRIELELPDAAGSRVTGSFAARIEGFRLIDGKPDYTKDSLQNLRYLAAEHLREELGRDVEIVSVERSWFKHAGGHSRTQTGAADVTYTLDGSSELRRFLYVKEPDAWRVDRVLDPSQLAEAHPYEEPRADGYERAVIAWKVAEAVEAHARALHGGSAIFPGDDFSVIDSYSAGTDDARVQASYRVAGDEEPVRMDVRLVRDGESWRVESLTPVSRREG